MTADDPIRTALPVAAGTAHRALPPRFTRRLAAVLIADVSGYARLMDRDEAGTHRRLHAIRAEVVEPAARGYGGHVIRCAGDGLLVNFASATDALLCAIGIQRTMAIRNAHLPTAEQIRFRISVNAADILFDDDLDIAGGGVNLAARLETLAEPGGICISGALRDLIQSSLDIRYIDAGRRRVKNIRRPVRVFRVLHGPLKPTAVLHAQLREGLAAIRRRLGLAAAAAAIMAFAVAADPLRFGPAADGRVKEPLMRAAAQYAARGVP
jgi:adenylate cyclase